MTETCANMCHAYVSPCHRQRKLSSFETDLSKCVTPSDTDVSHTFVRTFQEKMFVDLLHITLISLLIFQPNI